MKVIFALLRFIITILTIMACAGCTNATRPLTGSMGPWKLYGSTAQSFSGPNVTAMHMWDGTNVPQFVYGASAEAVGPVTIKAVAGVVGLATGGYALGSSLRPSSASIQSGNLDNQTFAQGGEVINPPR